MGTRVLIGTVACGLVAALGTFGNYYHVEVELLGRHREWSAGLWDDWWGDATDVMIKLGEDNYVTSLRATRTCSIIALLLAAAAIVASAVDLAGFRKVGPRVVVIVEALAGVFAAAAVIAWSAKMPWKTREHASATYGYGYFFEIIASLFCFAVAIAAHRASGAGNPLSNAYHSLA
mmetsp:Transcript_3388/g.10344  ORF Transcript_3388/g.10344 Transcript_3388/m.10344 type:complete len:176 (+) Transcript_3388:157-684(+)